MHAFAASAPNVMENASCIIAGLVWRAFDTLRADLLSRFQRDADDYVLEDSITAALEPRIQDQLTRYEPFYLQHQCPEEDTAREGSAQTPKYDFAFVARSNERSKWPVEAKVLRTDAAVGAYVADLKEQFLTCRYAPHSSEGAMMGYLLSGSPAVAFENIERAAACKLEEFPEALGRPHKVSSHNRTAATCATAPSPFRCHHILLVLSEATSEPDTAAHDFAALQEPGRLTSGTEEREPAVTG
jgi:hypothetical protein